jgi:protein-L-isoaspartate(D-aspartate) O-methyltransferase
MDRADELLIIRRAYAKQMLASVELNDLRVETAFAAVERERYLGPGPWPILRSFGYVLTPDADPVYLYSDVLIGIVPERGLNNGMPSYHAPLISSASISAGEHVVHIGAGVGDYTAIMAHLVGSHGRITAIEVDPRLAERATATGHRGQKSQPSMHAPLPPDFKDPDGWRREIESERRYA